MINEPKRLTEPITVDDLLAHPPTRPVSLAALAREGAVVEALFGKWERPRRHRLDPRRLIDRLRPPRPTMVEPPKAGKIVYSTARPGAGARCASCGRGQEGNVSGQGGCRTCGGHFMFGRKARPEDLCTSGRVPLVYYGPGEDVQSAEEAEQAVWWLARLARDEGER